MYRCKNILVHIMRGAHGARTFLSFILDAIDEFCQTGGGKKRWKYERYVVLARDGADCDLRGKRVLLKGSSEGTLAFTV